LPHPKLVNSTGLVVEPLVLADEECVPLAVPLIQGSWHIGEGGALKVFGSGNKAKFDWNRV
jgi:hypothetical protein